jgi:pimeloyl-ACP methyl ester carboxylesterase
MAILQMPGGELYYEVEGDGVPVVLIHGLALDARMWDDQVPALTDIARVVRYDVRGFGRSTRDADTSYSHADDLLRLLDRLGIAKAVLVGLSMGGRIVVEATLAAPEQVRALVLLDAVLDGVPWDPASERGMQAIGGGLRSGGLHEAKAAWLRHDFFVPAQRRPDVARRLAEMVGDYSGAGPEPCGRAREFSSARRAALSLIALMRTLTGARFVNLGAVLAHRASVSEHVTSGALRSELQRTRGVELRARTRARAGTSRSPGAPAGHRRPPARRPRWAV